MNSLKDNMLTNSVCKFIDILTNDLWNQAWWNAFVYFTSSKKLKNLFRFDKNFHGGWRLVSIWDDIPSSLVKPDQMSENVEDFFIESELCNKKEKITWFFLQST